MLGFVLQTDTLQRPGEPMHASIRLPNAHIYTCKLQLCTQKPMIFCSGLSSKDSSAP